jgi:hypothetical protein
MTAETTLKKPGDRIAIESRRAGGHAREGVVAEVLGPPGHEHYLVRWDDGEQSLYYPAHHAEAPAAASAAEPPTHVEEPAKPRLSAEPGDRLVIHGHHQGEPGRDGEILETRGPDGSPPFLVRWSDTGHEAIFYPASDAAVEHIVRRRER